MFSPIKCFLSVLLTLLSGSLFLILLTWRSGHKTLTISYLISNQSPCNLTFKKRLFILPIREMSSRKPWKWTQFQGIGRGLGFVITSPHRLTSTTKIFFPRSFLFMFSSHSQTKIISSDTQPDSQTDKQCEQHTHTCRWHKNTSLCFTF